MENILSNYSSPFLAAIAIGLSCGTGCSPIISIFLTSYIMGNSGNVKKGLLSFLYFFLGKTSVVVILAFLSALLGSTVLSKDGSLLGFNLNLVLDIFLILTGVFLILKLFLPIKGKCCVRLHGEQCSEAKRPAGLHGEQCSEAKRPASCSLCGRKEKTIKDKTGLAVFLIGAAYGITPCAPLLMILVLTSLSSPVSSIPISIVFSVATAISPLIVLTAMAGFFSKKMHDEIPQFIKLFQIISYVIFIIAGSVSLFFHLK